MEISRVHSLSKNCNDAELLELLNSWRGVNNVLISRKFTPQSLVNFSPVHCKSAYENDLKKYGMFSAGELRRKSDFLYRLINTKVNANAFERITK